jgi:hypothetical protein
MSQVPPWRRMGVARGSQLLKSPTTATRLRPEASRVNLTGWLAGPMASGEPTSRREPSHGSDYTPRHQEHYRSLPEPEIGAATALDEP